MKEIYVIPVEPLDSRYTAQWYDHIPKFIQKAADEKGIEVNIVTIDGEQIPPVPTPGAFLDFGATNIYKSSQLAVIAERFRQGLIKPGSKFLYTDGWNPTVIQLKYMSELLQIPVEIHSMFHAGSWDPQDFLGRLIGNKPWVRHAEKSMFACYDTNWFATNYHLNLFIENMFDTTDKASLMGSKSIDITGWPMEYLPDLLTPYAKLEKKKQIVFPHRIAPEKQLAIFKDLEIHMPEYEWIVCQEKTLTKHEYHTILGESMMVFSASTQETLGISSCAESTLCMSIPFAPNRLSYSEIFSEYPEFLYPSIWTENYEMYLNYRDVLINKIHNTMNSYNQLIPYIKRYNSITYPKYFHADKLITTLF